MNLSLGTATFGQPYGLLNRSSSLDDAECLQILDCAKSYGISSLDTAQSYGRSESIIGKSGAKSDFSISSKLDLGSQIIQPPHYFELRSKVVSSLESLGISSLDTLYIHTYPLPCSSHLDSIVDSLSKLKQLGLIHKIGASLYTPDQLDMISPYPIDVLQLPFSVVNQSFSSFLISNQLTRRYLIRIRSVFLQGLLLQRPTVNRFRHFSPRFINHLSVYFDYLVDNNLHPLDYALGTALSIPNADIIVGVFNSSQLIDICDSFHRVCSLARSNFFYPNTFAFDNSHDYDPRLWSIPN